MSNAGLTFKLFGEDVSASKALEGVGVKGKTVAKGLAAAFAGAKIKEAFDRGVGEGQVTANFEAAVNATPEQAKTAAELAGSMFRDGWGGSLQDVTGAITAVSQQIGDLGTMSAPELQGITQNAMAIAQAMGVDVVDVTNAAGDAMMHGLAPDAKSALDFVAAGLKSGANQSGDFLSSIGDFGDTFQRLGIDGPTALGMINASFAAGAPDVATAAKGVQTFTNVVSSDSATAGKAFKILGLNSDEMSQKIAAGGPGAKAAFSQVIQALGSMKDPVQQSIAGQALFGKGWKKAGDETVLALDPLAAKMTDTAGASTDMANTIHETTQTKIDGVKRTFDGWMQSLVDLPGPLGAVAGGAMAIGPTVVTMGSSVLMGAQALKSLELASMAGSVAHGIQTVAMGVWNIAAGIGATITWALGAAFAFLTSPIGLIIIAVVALTAGFIWLWNNCQWFQDFIIASWEAIKSALSAVWDFITGAVYAVGQAITGAFTAVVDFFAGAWDKIKGAATAVWDAIQSAIESVVSFFTDAWNNAIDGFKTIFRAIGGFFSGIWDGIKDTVGGVIDWIKGAFQGAVDWIGDIFGKVGGVVKGAFDGVVGFLKAPVNGIIKMVNWVIDQLNKISFDVPSWVPFIGGNHVGINLGHIPELAEGGVVMPRSGGTLARIGEAGQAEAVIPLDRFGSLGGGTTVHVHVSGALVGSKHELARYLVDSLNAAQRQGMVPPNALAGLSRG